MKFSVLSSALCALAPTALSQGTVSDVFSSPGLPGLWYPSAAVVDEDAGGAVLYVAGHFEAAGRTPARRVARYDGRAFAPLGAGLDFAAEELVFFDEGAGAKLHALGKSATGDLLYRYDGTAWTAIPSQADQHGYRPVRALTFDGELIVGGTFSTVAGVAARSVASFDGTTWSPLGQGVWGSVHALAVYDDGAGPALYAAGAIGLPGSGAYPFHVARWDGTAWGPAGAGIDFDGHVDGLTVFDGELIAIGTFATVGGVQVNGIARWDGARWAPVGSGVGIVGRAWSVEVHASGADARPELIVGGSIVSIDGVSTGDVAAWDGRRWRGFAEGLGDADVRHLASGRLAGAAAPELFALGRLGRAPGWVGHGISRWDGAHWTSLERGQGLFGHVYDLLVQDDGSLLAAGFPLKASGECVGAVSRWDGSAWSAVGEPVPGNAVSLEVFDAEIYLGGSYGAQGLLRYRDGRWTPPGGGTIGAWVWDQVVYDDGRGPALFVAGEIYEAGDLRVENIARWDGASWSDVGGGVGSPSGAWVRALEVYDDGRGPALYAAGSFYKAAYSSGAQVYASNFARWDGATWSGDPATLAVGFWDLLTYDDGSGEQLYATGDFWQTGGEPWLVFRYDGATWEPVGNGAVDVFDWCDRLAVFEEGDRRSLVASGTSASTPGETVIARWDGIRWTELARTNGRVLALADAGRSLFLGGEFHLLDGVPSTHFGQWFPPTVRTR